MPGPRLSDAALGLHEMHHGGKKNVDSKLEWSRDFKGTNREKIEKNPAKVS